MRAFAVGELGKPGSVVEVPSRNSLKDRCASVWPRPA
jgi:hypothetical protein